MNDSARIITSRGQKYGFGLFAAFAFVIVIVTDHTLVRVGGLLMSAFAAWMLASSYFGRLEWNATTMRFRSLMWKREIDLTALVEFQAYIVEEINPILNRVTQETVNVHLKDSHGASIQVSPSAMDNDRWMSAVLQGVNRSQENGHLVVDEQHVAVLKGHIEAASQ